MTDRACADMFEYKVYLLDARGRVQRRQALQAASDECALWLLARLDLPQCAELWRQGRRIGAISRDGRAERF